jgi:hypothetical protein
MNPMDPIITSAREESVSVDSGTGSTNGPLESIEKKRYDARFNEHLSEEVTVDICEQNILRLCLEFVVLNATGA